MKFCLYYFNELLNPFSFIYIDLRLKLLSNEDVENGCADLENLTLYAQDGKVYSGDNIVQFFKDYYPYEIIDNDMFIYIKGNGLFTNTNVDILFDIQKIDNKCNKDIILFDTLFIDIKEGISCRDYSTLWLYCKNTDTGDHFRKNYFDIDKDTCAITVTSTSGTYRFIPKYLTKVAEGIFTVNYRNIERNGFLILDKLVILTTAKAQLIGVDKVREIYKI